jgi:thiol-disulfide isomerase/thioredoxin
MKLKIIAFILFSTLIVSTKAESYKIKLSLKNTKDTSVYLAHYYDGKVFSIDTTSIKPNGKAIFSKNKKLPSGLYLIYLPSRKYFDIFIGKDQTISISSDMMNIQNSLKIKGSIESIYFREYQSFLREKTKERKNIIDKDDKIEFNNKMKFINTEMQKYIKNISTELPNSSLSSFVNFTLSPETPDYDKIINHNIENRKDSIAILSYFYNKKHYWDNANLSDSTLLRTPIFKSKLDNYFNNTLILHPDTITNASNMLIESARGNKEMFRYLCSYCFNYSLNSKIMGMDRAFYNIANKYYLSNDVYWLTDSTRNKIKEKVLKLQYNLIGNKARDIKLQTIDGELTSLYTTDANLTLMVFWEPNCGHCKKEMPQLKTEILEKYADKGLKVFAVNIQNNKAEWNKFVEDHELFDFINCNDPKNTSNFRFYYNIDSTPMLYLLDKNKKIIAKKIDINTLSKIIKSKI